MVVISQDGKKLVNFNKVSKIFIHENTKIALEFENAQCEGLCMGEYSTEEKATAVLNMFFEVCVKNRKCFQIPRDERVRMK